MSHALPDVLTKNTLAIFVGTAAGKASAAAGMYYAHPGNQFWKVLHRTGLTDRQLAPSEFRLLPNYSLGLTDVEKERSGSDAEAVHDHTDRFDLAARLKKVAPQIVAFNGKKAAEIALKRSVEYGLQPERVAGSETWVLPSTSGAARGAWKEEVWVAFGQRVDELRQLRSSHRRR